jgi:cadmium resistance protein CadD (predicted permease)
MTQLISTILVAAVAFAACNIGDMFILLSFFINPRFSTREIVWGQYLSVSALIVICLVLGLSVASISPIFLRALGILPIFIGVKNLLQARTLLRSELEEEKRIVRRMGFNSLSVAAVTFADGSDNLGVFTPLFAHSTATEISLMIVVFLALVAAWCAGAHYLVHHPKLGKHIRSYGSIVAPLALIVIGVFILV